MNIPKVSDAGLLMMHEGVRDALKKDDSALTGSKPYGVREYPDWKEWADGIEAILKERGVDFEPINWKK